MFKTFPLKSKISFNFFIKQSPAEKARFLLFFCRIVLLKHSELIK